jgi:hypothetical protein
MVKKPATRDVHKLSKSSVNYSKGMGKTRCRNCSHYAGAGVCRLVAGEINPDYWCRKFTSRGK